MKRRHNLADDYNEIKRSIECMKVYDLQIILNMFNLSKSGRKFELQDRLLSFYKDDRLKDNERTQLCTKIYEITRNQASLQQMSLKISQELQPKRLKLPEETQNIPNGLPNQPELKLKKIPFYDNLGTLLNPTILLLSDPYKSDQIRNLKFCLTSKQAVDIEKNRSFKNAIVEYNVQVQLRLCLMDAASPQNDFLPNNLQIRVNNRIVPLPSFLPARPNTVPKRRSVPFNITPFVKISATASNIIEVRWQREVNKVYITECSLVKKLSSGDLIDRLITKGEDFTRKMIKDKFGPEIDSEIATTALRVSLLCPLGKVRINEPCRATTCKHLQCFDTMLYLQMNEFKQSWICPVCGEEALFENLVIDGYFKNVLRKVDSDINEIQLHKDGSWSKLEDPKQLSQQDDDEGFLISDDDDDEDVNNNNTNNIKEVKSEITDVKKPQDVKNGINIKLPKLQVASSSKTPKSPSETIDLTLDDD